MSIIQAPMREPTYFILAALLDGPLHGYAVIKHVEELAAGRVRLAAGTLYAALDRLAAEGLIQVVSEEIVNGRARRYYGLTDQGQAAVQAEAARMAAAAVVVIRRSARTVGTSIVVRPA
jgi:DNA-binding PadR family transcriptional regulator